MRFRHADSDIVRAARQQDFLRAAKDQLSTSSLINQRGKLIKILKKSTQTDPSLRSVGDVIKLAQARRSSPPATRWPRSSSRRTFTGDPQTGEYVEASAETIARLRDQFYHASPQVKKAQVLQQRQVVEERRAATPGSRRPSSSRATPAGGGRRRTRRRRATASASASTSRVA